ncbi:MAG: ABC transporter substrate-binding protein [Bacteroidales bacterium]|nr:ABC transporter substrate-binding protein [Bacteroidales bacterium]
MKHLLPLLLAVALAACTGHRHDDKQIFRYNESAGIATLDPAFSKDQSIIWPCRQLYNGLVELDSAMQVRPSVAKSWSVSPDGLFYTFILRDDVLFHKNALFGTPDSTRKVVAADFVYSFGRITDPTVASPGTWIFSNVDKVEATDDTTLVIKLKSPFSPFLGQLGMVYCSVVPHEVVEHYGKDFRSHPCGTGPFQFQYWKEGVKLVLRKNPHYFEFDTVEQADRQTIQRLPYLDAVAVTFIVDRQTVFLEFVKGNLDFMNSLDASYKDELLTQEGKLREKYADRIDMTSTPYLNTEYLGFNMSSELSPTANLKLRQAINCGFDRRKMMRYLRNNIGTPGVYGFIPVGLPGGVSEPVYEYNPERAKQLLAEAGYPDGKGLPRLKLSTTANYLDLCKYIQQQLGLIGIDIQVDVNPPAALREQMAQGKVEWFRGSWVADYPDAENYLSLFYSPNRAPAGPNYTRFCDKRFDRLYNEARKETDPERCTALYQKLDALVMEQAPVVVLYYDQILHFTHKNVHGLRTNAMNTLDLRWVKIEK